MTKAGKSPPRPCRFPFKHKGKTYNSCTTDEDSDGKYWCSTKVDSNGELVRGNWGYCDENCVTAINAVNDSQIR